MLVCFCKQKTAYEMRISDWSSDVCSSDLRRELWTVPGYGPERAFQWPPARKSQSRPMKAIAGVGGRGMVFQRGAERSLCGVAVVALLGLTAPPLLAQPLSNDLETKLLELERTLEQQRLEIQALREELLE